MNLTKKIVVVFSWGFTKRLLTSENGDFSSDTMGDESVNMPWLPYGRGGANPTY